MKWIKQGIIFEPKGNIEWMKTHAALPIADNLGGDLYRIYFSSRDSKNRSFTCFIDININNPRKILNISRRPILSPGELGTFDDSGTMASCIVNSDKKKYLYYIGWNVGMNIPYRNSIGLAISDNKKTFKKWSKGPIIDRDSLEPYFTASCYVMIENRIWKMWYLSGVGWTVYDGKPRPRYHIKYAESKDGINWKRNGVVSIDFKNKSEWAISRPSIIKESKNYNMWYSYRENSNYRIGYAESKDGINWKRKDDEAGIDVSKSGWDSEMIEYPFVFVHKGKKYMLYNGNNYGKTGFGYATLSNS
ncbi:MAG: hypothetical protein WBF38_09885 [Nitrosotalea sp.]